MQHFFKTLLILYNIFSTVRASEISYYEFNPLNYAGHESEYDVIVPKIESDDGNGNVVYKKVLQQAITSDCNKTPVFADTSTETSTITDTGNKVFVQQYGNSIKYDTNMYQYDGNMPVIVKALKSDFSTPYIKDEKEVFRQKIKKQYNESYDNLNYSDVNLQFDENGNPKFVVENGEEKQAIDNSRQNMPWVSVYDEGAGITTLFYGTTIRIQKPKSPSYNLAYDSNGRPVVVQTKTESGQLYSEKGIAVFRQRFENDDDIELEFDNLGNPVFIKKENNIFKQATTTSGDDAFVVSYDNYSFDDIYVSDQVEPVLIQQWYPDNDDSYNTKFVAANNGTFSSLVKACCKNGSYYKRNGIQVFRQVTIYETYFKFDIDKNPILLSTFIPSFDGTIEADGYNIGELILKDGKKKCRTNEVQWYDLGTYQQCNGKDDHTVELNNSMNFIIKDDYTLKYGVSCGNYTSRLFIPKNITLTMSSNISSNNGFDCLLLGNLESNNTASSCFNIAGNNFNFIIGPESTISIENNTNNYFTSNNTTFVNTIIYPSLLSEDFVLNDKHLTSDGDNITAITDVENVNTFCNGGVLYLNKFTKDDSEKARKLKGIINSNINIVFPEFLASNREYYFENVCIDGQHFIRTTFFPNLLWSVASNEAHNPGTLIPTSSDSDNGQYFFDKQNYKYEDIYETSLQWKDYKENGVVLALDGPGTKIGTNTNPFVEYDEKFSNITLSDEPISKLISNKSFAANGSEYNITQYNSKNCYWDTSTVQECFKDGILYYTGGQVAGILNNLPAELNIGLINESNPNKDNERVSTAANVTVITLNGDNQYFDGIYTVPYNDNSNGNTVINLNNKYALVKMEQLDSNGDVQYRTANTPSSGVDLQHLNYNVMTNIYWKLNKTGENLIDNTKITLDMNLSNTVTTGTGPFITFTGSTNDTRALETLEFTGNNSKYTLTGNSNNTDLSQRNYFIPSFSLKTIIYKDNQAIVKIGTGQNLLYTYHNSYNMIDEKNQLNFIGLILIKKMVDSAHAICKIQHGSTAYVKTDDWYLSTDVKKQNPLNETINNNYFYNIASPEPIDNRDTIVDMRKSDYWYNEYDGDEQPNYLDTTQTEVVDKINECFYNDEDARNKMPPIINMNLINKNNITIVNDNPSNTIVEFTGNNAGMRNWDTNKLYCYDTNTQYCYDTNNQLVQDISIATEEPVGKPYTGTATVPHEITEIKFGLGSFIPNINTFQNSNNQGSTTEYTNDYTFIYNNNVQKYKVDNGLQDIDGDGSNIDYPIETLNLNLNKITTGTDTITAETTFNKANVQCTNFTIKADSVVNLNNNTHLSIKSKNPE